MPPANILAKLQTILEAQLGIEKSKIVPTANFAQDLHADSLDHVEIIMAVEDEFDIGINDEDAVNIKTVQDAIDLIEPRLA